MTELAVAFEEHRHYLRLTAYRILGSASEADDAVQETWFKLTRADTSAVENLRGWLTTVVSRQCLDMLRSRASRREEALAAAPEPTVDARPLEDRELSESVGAALLIVLDKLEPAERLAFVLHDLLSMPFDEIAAIVGKSPAATRQLASRARRRVQGASAPPVDLATQRRVVETFIAALRAGDIDALAAVLAPGAVVRMDGGDATTVQDARGWAAGAVKFKGAAQHMRPVLVDGGIALAFAPHGQVQRVLVFRFDGNNIRDFEIITEADAIAELGVAEPP